MFLKGKENDEIIKSEQSKSSSSESSILNSDEEE